MEDAGSGLEDKKEATEEEKLLQLRIQAQKVMDEKMGVNRRGKGQLPGGLVYVSRLIWAL